MKLAELIHDMSKLNVELSDFEQKFGVKSPDIPSHYCRRIRTIRRA